MENGAQFNLSVPNGVDIRPLSSEYGEAQDQITRLTKLRFDIFGAQLMDGLIGDFSSWAFASETVEAGNADVMIAYDDNEAIVGGALVQYLDDDSFEHGGRTAMVDLGDVFVVDYLRGHRLGTTLVNSALLHNVPVQDDRIIHPSQVIYTNEFGVEIPRSMSTERWFDIRRRALTSGSELAFKLTRGAIARSPLAGIEMVTDQSSSHVEVEGVSSADHGRLILSVNGMTGFCEDGNKSLWVYRRGELTVQLSPQDDVSMRRRMWLINSAFGDEIEFEGYRIPFLAASKALSILEDKHSVVF